jgi:hypothetical protein
MAGVVDADQHGPTGPRRFVRDQIELGRHVDGLGRGKLKGGEIHHCCKQGNIFSPLRRGMRFVSYLRNLVKVLLLENHAHLLHDLRKG